MKKNILLLVTACFAVTLYGQKIQYDLSCENAVHHEAEISITVSGLQNKPAVFRMSRSSPGRYATHEFGKNIYNVHATDKLGNALLVNRTDGDVYEVPVHKGFIKLSYTLYGNYADGTYAGIDATNLHLNMPASFIWLKGADKQPIEIHFHLPAEKNWQIATQLKPTDNPQTFTAPGLQYFMDCPTKIGNLHFRNWEVTNKDGKKYAFRFALDSKATDAAIDSFVPKLQRIVQEAKAVFTEFPSYDYGMYTYLVSVSPYMYGDGMEHRNSTMISLPFGFEDINQETEVFAHEFFHCWNVERIRPKTLEPFNFEKSNMSNELWVAEGFTQYYGQLLVTRAGLQTDTAYAINIIKGLVNTKLNTPGAKYYTPIQASNNAVFVDAGVAVDKTNYPNTNTSYYPYGASLALALDLQLRSSYHSSLDQFMQQLWIKFGKKEIPYTLKDLQQTLAELTHDAPFAERFFHRYVYGHEAIDYTTLLAQAGFAVRTESPGIAWLGGRFNNTEDGVVLAANTIRQTPLYTAGLDVNDVLVFLDGKPVQKKEDIKNIIAAHKPGDVIDVVYKHQDETINGKIALQENPSFAVLPYENTGLTVTHAIQQFRAAWLGSKAN